MAFRSRNCDLSLSLSQMAVGKENERGEPFQKDSAEYFAGHTIDALGYRKLHELDPEYRKRQYQLVEPHLNIVSNPPAATVTMEAQKSLEQIEAENKELKARLERLAISVERLTLATESKTRPVGRNQVKSGVKPNDISSGSKMPAKVISSSEQWDIYRVHETGDMYRIKMFVTEVYRVRDRFDQFGEPQYVVARGQVVAPVAKGYEKIDLTGRSEDHKS
jgi:hypothetical protein